MTKRLFDVAVSLGGLILLLPAFILVAVAQKLDSRGPVLYRSRRVGMGGRPFDMLKFRSMVADADKIGGPSTSADDPRLTRMGRFLRATKLDEVPQLLNVLRGEMSLVGPRPEVPQEVALYTEEQRRILTVRPGITDFASIRFRNEGEILRGAADPHRAFKERIQPEKLRLALEYVDRQSLWTDLRILFLTAKAVLCDA